MNFKYLVLKCKNVFSKKGSRGMVVLGSSIGHTGFMHAWAVCRVLEEQELLQQLPSLADLQCSWLMLAFCASPRAIRALRTVPPPEVARYAAKHDDAIWHKLLDCLGGADLKS